MKRYTVILSPRATREIDEAAMWWADRGSPTLIDDAVAAVLDRLQAFPLSAPRLQLRGVWTNTRRAAVEPGYHLYYEVDQRAETLFVRRFRHERQRPLRRL